MNDVPSTPVARGGWMLIGLTSINIVIQLIVAGIVKYSTQVAWTTLWVMALIYAVVLLLNGVRFVVWGVIHQRYPLGIAYASSALLFPCIVALSAYYGEPVTWRNIAGVVLVMVGVIALVRDVE
jgi:drug/metabolite transporter (DMT)-like permease